MTAVDVQRWTAYERGPAVLQVIVLGHPVPQGSIRSLGRGRPSVHANAARLLPWRGRMCGELQASVLTGRGGFPLTGPVVVDLSCTMPKPKAAPKRRRTFPVTAPDLDKLARAVGDALQESGVVGNDSQIVEWCARKVFPGEHRLALSSPGVLITVSQIL